MRERINKNVIGMWSALKGLMVLVVILTHSIAEGATLCRPAGQWLEKAA